MMRNRKVDDAPNGGSTESVLREQLLNHTSRPEDQHRQSVGGHQLQHPHAHNIDPAISGHPLPPPPPPQPASISSGAAPAPIMSHPPINDDDDDDGSDPSKRGAKRELSTTKRAAQNRAAQRAFRQRKEGHIKKLEQQVQEYGAMMENYKRMQNENYSLREYIISLQSRLLESQGEYPPAPLNIDLSGPRDHAAPLPAASQSQSQQGHSQSHPQSQGQNQGLSQPHAPQAPMASAAALQNIAQASQDTTMTGQAGVKAGN